MEKRIGIMGGSFDPIHQGHLAIAGSALSSFELDTVLFVPARRAPLKSKHPAASAEQRREMVELAISEFPDFALSDVDLRNDAVSYSIETANRLKAQYPRAELRWILGADQIAQLHHWRAISELGELLSFIAFARRGSEANPSSELPDHVIVDLADAPLIDISSSEIRRRLLAGSPVKHFLPEKVFAYIKARNLYGIE